MSKRWFYLGHTSIFLTIFFTQTSPKTLPTHHNITQDDDVTAQVETVVKHSIVGESIGQLDEPQTNLGNLPPWIKPVLEAYLDSRQLTLLSAKYRCCLVLTNWCFYQGWN